MPATLVCTVYIPKGNLGHEKFILFWPSDIYFPLFISDGTLQVNRNSYQLIMFPNTANILVMWTLFSIGAERTDQISVQSSDDLQGIHSTSFLDQMLIKPFTKSTNQRQDNDDFITENALMGVKWGFVAWLLTAISKYDFFQN